MKLTGTELERLRTLDTVTADDRELLKRLCDEMSPGPWTHDAEGFDSWACPVLFATTVPPDPSPVTYVCTVDSTFILAARVAVPALLAEIDRLSRLLGGDS